MTQWQRFSRCGAVGLALAVSATTAFAVEPAAVSLDEEASAEGASSDEALPGDDTSEAVDKDTEHEGRSPEEEAPLSEEVAGSPVEERGETYYFPGVRYRGIILPQFMMNMFADGGQTLYVNSFGLEFGIRKDDFEIIPSIWYADYGMDPTPFKSKSDPPESWELVESNLKVLFLTADFLWSTPIAPQFAINYGAGAGFGLVFGDIIRNDAYFPNGAATSDGAGLVECGSPNNPAAPGGSCPPDGQYDFNEPSWTNSGSKPVIFPWLVVQTGLRYKPHRNFVGRLDLGFGTSGFFFGLGADYGI
jgi:hypothetical protein